MFEKAATIPSLDGMNLTFTLYPDPVEAVLAAVVDVFLKYGRSFLALTLVGIARERRAKEKSTKIIFLVTLL